LVSRFAFASCLLTAVAATAQVTGASPPQTEQVETGTVMVNQIPTGAFEGVVHGFQRRYRIRLLPVSSFPQLPAPVAQQLVQKGCLIPQTYEAHEPENAIHGSFEKKGSNDWAALCSINRVTTLYVFFQSALDHPISLRHQPDNEWLGVEWSLDYGSAWGIARRPPHLIQPKGTADHDGIDDAFVEKSTTVHYFENGHWTTRDVNQ
jgi:hypothetical protein